MGDEMTRQAACGTGGTRRDGGRMSRFASKANREGQAGHSREGFPPFRGETPNVPPVPMAGQGGQLVELARRIERLAPSHRDPEAFHVERDEIAKTLRRMARG